MAEKQGSQLQRRYNNLADRYRAMWAYYQFLQRLGKVFEEVGVTEESPWFRDIYKELKAIGGDVGAEEGESVSGRLDEVGARLAMLTGSLLEQDSSVTPEYLRLFFERVKNPDRKVLIQLLRFYLYSYERGDWTPERLDKTDFLATCLAEQFLADPMLAASLDRRDLREIIVELWRLLQLPPPKGDVAKKHAEAIEAIRDEAVQVRTLEQLNDQQILPRYRNLKHELGALFFHPDILLAIQETNLVLKEIIRERFQQEKQQIISDYQQVLTQDHETAAPGLEEELNELRDEVEKFEDKLQSEELQLNTLAQINRRVRSILPRLTGSALEEEAEEEEPTEERSTEKSQASGVEESVLFDRDQALQEDATFSDVTPAAASRLELVDDYLRQLVSGLDEVDPDASPKEVSVSPHVFDFRVEPREVISFRRLQSGESCDREKEGFLLEAAALRLRIGEEARQIKELLDATGGTGETEAFSRARLTISLADEFLRRFGHLIDQAVLDGEFKEAYHLQICRMRLMRDYSGLWLVACKPFLFHRAHQPVAD